MNLHGATSRGGRLARLRMVVVVLLVFCVQLCAFPCLQANAAEATTANGDPAVVHIGSSTSTSDPIKMGFIVIDNYNYVDAVGEWRGYDIELMLKMVQYGSYSIDAIPFYSSADALEALRTGEVDRS